MRMVPRIRLAVIMSADKTLRDLVTFDFVASHLFSSGLRHSSAVAKLLRLIDKSDELHTKVQGMISPPHLAKTLLYDVLRRWSQYLNRCMAASVSEVVEAPGARVPLSIEPILVDLEGGLYIGPILPVSLANRVSGRRSSGGGDSKSGGGSSNGNGSGGNKKPLPKVAATGGTARVKV